MTQKSETLFYSINNSTSPHCPPEISEKHEERITTTSATGSLWGLPDEALVTSKQAADMLQRSVRTLEGWRLRHTGPDYIAGGRVSYRVGALKDYLNRMTVATAA